MIKYLSQRHFLAFVVFSLMTWSSLAQNVTVEIDGEDLYYSEPGCSDCNGDADPRWRYRAVVGGNNYDWNYDRDGFCGWSGTTNYSWVPALTQSSTANLAIQLNGYESDNFLCGGDDNTCSGYSTVANVTINSNPPCTWNYMSVATRNCGSGTYGVYWSAYRDWET